MTNHLESTVLQHLASVNENYKEEGEKVRGVSDTHTHACTHSWRYTTRLYGVPHLKTVFLVTTVRLLKFHKLFTLKVIMLNNFTVAGE